MLELIGVTKKRGKFTLKNISFKLEEGYLLGIVGKNGAGKTTLLNTIADEKKKYTGEILYKGKNISKNYEDFIKECAYITEDAVFLMANTVMENAKTLAVFYDEFDMNAFTDMLKENKIPEDRYLDKLSRGEFIKFQLALARARNSRLYLLDDVTAGMDPIYRKEFYRLLKKLQEDGCTIIMTTHIISDLNRNVDYIMELDGGKIVSYKENDGGNYYE